MLAIARSRSLSLRVVLLLGLVFSAALIWFTSSQPLRAVEPPSTQNLPWEYVTGGVDISKLPTSLPVLDCNGNIVGTLNDPFNNTWVPTTPSGQSCVSMTKTYESDP